MCNKNLSPVEDYLAGKEKHDDAFDRLVQTLPYQWYGEYLYFTAFRGTYTTAIYCQPNIVEVPSGRIVKTLLNYYGQYIGNVSKKKIGGIVYRKNRATTNRVGMGTRDSFFIKYKLQFNW